MADVFSVMDKSGKIIESSANPVKLTGLASNTLYSGMTAVRNYGTDKLDIPDQGTTPGAPSISVSAGDGSATVSVVKSAEDGSISIAKATVQYKTTEGSVWTTVNTDSSLKATISGLTNGTEYQVKASLSNQFGDGDVSQQSSFTPAKPVVPVTGVTADSSLSVKVGSTVKINIAVQPDNATDKAYTVTSKDTSLATVAQDGTATGVKAGTVEIDTVSHADPTKVAKTTLTVTE